MANTPLFGAERILFGENQSYSSVEMVLFIVERTCSCSESISFSVERDHFFENQSHNSVETVHFVAKGTVSGRDEVLPSLEGILSNVNSSVFCSDAFVFDAIYALST
ncbi:hypothetical protein [uncultured Acetobacteroides sp.]|uniref:hypothetical protein n=1 Tax=uncultured Acetobacteroides sp. TaxID=1760811 RepID=UPI0029F5C8A9|nr:hypothetical protein [uncultured Acetobacteroides sp.]